MLIADAIEYAACRLGNCSFQKRASDRNDLPDIKRGAAIADSGGLTAGAARIHLAPSSASHRLSQLEAALGPPLFRRHARGLTPTPAGESLLRHILKVDRAYAPFLEAAGVV